MGLPFGVSEFSHSCFQLREDRLKARLRRVRESATVSPQIDMSYWMFTSSGRACEPSMRLIASRTMTAFCLLK